MLGKMTRSIRRVSLALVAAVAGALLLSAGSADAAPLALGKSTLAQSEALDGDVILVRDGCGPGMRWSHRRRDCVEDFRGPPPAVMVRPDCRPGWRWSNGRGACVPAGGGVDPAAAIVGGVIGAAVGIAAGANRPRGCGPGMRWSDRRRACVPM